MAFCLPFVSVNNIRTNLHTYTLLGAFGSLASVSRTETILMQ